VEPNPNIPAIASIEAACSREVARVASPLNDEQRRAIRVALRAALSAASARGKEAGRG
jgi:ribosomal protein S2